MLLRFAATNISIPLNHLERYWLLLSTAVCFFPLQQPSRKKDEQLRLVAEAQSRIAANALEMQRAVVSAIPEWCGFGSLGP